MTKPELRPILDRRFRANPAYRAVVFDRLPSQMQESLQGLRDLPNLYGVLEPQSPDRTYKAISRDVALLFFTLREPGPLPPPRLASLPAKNSSIACIVSPVFREWRV